MPEPTPRRPKARVVAIAVGVVVVIAVGALALAPTIVRSAQKAELSGQRGPLSDDPLGGLAVDRDGTFAYVSSGYGPGDVQTFGDDAVGFDLDPFLTLVAADEPVERVDPGTLVDRVWAASDGCAEHGTGGILMLRNADHPLTVAGCAFPGGRVTRSRVWLGDEELDTGFRAWTQDAGLLFLERLAANFDGEFRVASLDLTPRTASLGLLVPRSPDTCRVITWTWQLDDGGPITGRTDCEKIAPGVDIERYPSVRDFSASDLAAALDASLADAALPGRDRVSSLALGFGRPDRSLPQIRGVVDGVDFASPLRTADREALSQPLADLTDLSLRVWPAKAGDWSAQFVEVIEAPYSTARYADGTVLTVAGALRLDRSSPDPFGDLTDHLRERRSIGEDVCGLGPIPGFSDEGWLCLREYGDAALVSRYRGAGTADPEALADLNRSLAEAFA